jgi:hypothetical protein
MQSVSYTHFLYSRVLHFRLAERIKMLHIVTYIAMMVSSKAFLGCLDRSRSFPLLPLDFRALDFV